MNTQQPVGFCKGPSCTCWTPGGCVGHSAKDMMALYPDKTCIKGPCWSYEACVSEKCQVHAGCVVNDILAFWGRQYRAAVAYVLPTVQRIEDNVRRQGLRILAPLPVEIIAGPVTEAPPTGTAEVSQGCPPGHVWTVGLTGYRCTPREWNLTRATFAELVAAGILPEPQDVG